MYKVLLVDDEPWALIGVREFFEWEKEGFEVIAQTTRSVEALEIILAEKPDVVFTDIRMPKISGIELMQKVREEGLDTEFIVISGYSEFSYAQKAIQLGAFDYCLKPMDTEYTNDLLQRLSNHLQQQKSSNSHKIFEAIVENKENLTQLLIEGGLGTSYPFYQAIVAYAGQSSDFNKTVHHKIPIEKSIFITLGRSKFLYIANTAADLSESVFADAAKYVSLGFSPLAGSPEEALKLYYQADMAAAGYFINDGQTVFKYNKKDMASLQHPISSFASHMQNGNIAALQELVENMPAFFMTNQLGMEELVYFWNKLVAVATEYTGGKDSWNIFEFMDSHQLMTQFENMKVLCDCLLTELVCLLGNPSDPQILSESMNRDFQKLLTYINEHFAEQLYLKDLARMFYINQNYCCNLFKKHTGGTFSEYVNNLRISRSKELLEDIDLTIEEVAQKSGYNDYYYFNKLFKKYFGITPAKYRKDSISSKSTNRGMIKNGLS